MAWGASLVCNVANTKWPVSAMVRAIWIESMSRISPIRRTSGSSRNAERRARSKEGLSRPISRWETADVLWWCTYSTGSSMVRMCAALVSLILSMMDANVVDLPDPVGPVTKTKPRGCSETHVAAAGRPRSSKFGILAGITRRASAVCPRCVKILPRIRARSSHEKAKSTSS